MELSSFLKPSLNPEKEEEADAIFSSSSEDGMEDLDEQSKPQIVPQNIEKSTPKSTIPRQSVVYL